MQVREKISHRKPTIFKKWFHLTIETYPEDTRRFLLRESDPFNNPVGATIKTSLESLLEQAVASRIDPYSVAESLQGLIKIRAVQDMPPSKAVEFIYGLKDILRHEFKELYRDPSASDQLHRLDMNIDRIALIGFDLYMDSREKIFELRMRQARQFPNLHIENINKERK